MGGGAMWIIANFKANKNIKESIDWVEIVGPKLEKREDLKVVVCPSFSAIEQVKKTVLVGNFPLMVGSQDISKFPPGSFTGEEPAQFLKEFIDLSIIGHSERRQNFSETEEDIKQKTELAIKSEIIPLVCIQDKDGQIPSGCSLVAYEPVWAIGSGKPDTPASAGEVALVLREKYGENLEVLYGGSVNPENAEAFIQQDNISGVLIASASLNPEEFLEVIQACSH